MQGGKYTVGDYSYLEFDIRPIRRIADIGRKSKSELIELMYLALSMKDVAWYNYLKSMYDRRF